MQTTPVIDYIVAAVVAGIGGFALLLKYWPKLGGSVPHSGGNGYSPREFGEIKAHAEHAAENIQVLKQDVRRLFDRQEKMPSEIVKAIREDRDNCPHAKMTEVMWKDFVKSRDT